MPWACCQFQIGNINMPVDQIEYKPLRISCNIPIDFRKSRKALEKKYEEIRAKQEKEKQGSASSNKALPDCDDAVALGLFLFSE